MLNTQNKTGNPINLKNLSLQKKILLVQDIWDDISSSQENISISDDQKQELELRLNNYKLKPQDGKNWNLVREEIKSKL